jgi:hypothetical protein
VLILPGVRSMGDSDIAAIKAWVADHGNTLISVGDLPDLNEIGMKSDKKRWDNINDRLFKQITFPERPTAAEAFNFKKGNFISVKKDIVASALPEHYTKQYRDNLDDIHCQPDTKNREYLSAVILKGLSMSHAEPPIEVLNCPEKIEVNFMESKENGNHIIHLLNHGEEKIKNIKIILNSCAGRRPNVFISPDACDAKNMELALLDTVLENGKVSVTVPVLEKYRLVILREE